MSRYVAGFLVSFRHLFGILLALLFTIPVGSVRAEGAAGETRLHVISIGINTYPGMGSAYAELKYCAADAEAVGAVFEKRYPDAGASVVVLTDRGDKHTFPSNSTPRQTTEMTIQTTPTRTTATQDAPASGDGADRALLAAYFEARDAAREKTAFDALTRRGAELLETLTRKHARTDEEAGDLYARAVARLVSQLRFLRERYTQNEAARRAGGIIARTFSRKSPLPITHFAGFVACLVRFVLRDFLLETRPQWRQLYQRLRLLFRGDGEFALWTGRDGRLVAGLAPWRGAEPTADVAALRRSPESVATDGLAKVGGDAAHDTPNTASERVLCAALLLATQKPLRFTELIRAVATIKRLDGLPEVSLTSLDPDSDAAEWDIVDSSPLAENPESSVARREATRRLWGEVSNLVTPERKSLLPAKIATGTNADGKADPSCALELFFLARAASFADMAIAMQRSEEDFLRGVWRTLPWDDKVIATDIPTGFDKVRQLRRQARKRLGVFFGVFAEGDSL